MCMRIEIVRSGVLITLDSISYHLFLQLYSDFKKLVETVAANTTNVCCFNTSNITVVSRSFPTDKDPVPYIEDVFVSLSMSSYVSLMKYVFGTQQCLIQCIAITELTC